MTKCLIFDLDGTLVKLPIRYELLQKNLKDFFNIEDDLSPLIPSIIEHAQNNQNIIDKAFEIICKEELIASNSLEIIEGLDDVIQHIISQNYTISLLLCNVKNL